MTLIGHPGIEYLYARVLPCDLNNEFYLLIKKLLTETDPKEALYQILLRGDRELYLAYYCNHKCPLEVLWKGAEDPKATPLELLAIMVNKNATRELIEGIITRAYEAGGEEIAVGVRYLNDSHYVEKLKELWESIDI